MVSTLLGPKSSITGRSLRNLRHTHISAKTLGIGEFKCFSLIRDGPHPTACHQSPVPVSARSGALYDSQHTGGLGHPESQSSMWGLGSMGRQGEHICRFPDFPAINSALSSLHWSRGPSAGDRRVALPSGPLLQGVQREPALVNRWKQSRMLSQIPSALKGSARGMVYAPG